jgi:hypothetical protein
MKRLATRGAAVGMVAGLWLLGVSKAGVDAIFQHTDVVTSGLSLTMHVGKAGAGESDAPKFTVEFRNTGEKELLLNLGTMLANGIKQILGRVVLTVTDSEGKSHSLHDLRESGLIAGRLDPLVVPLCAGCAFSFLVDFQNYHLKCARPSHLQT